MTCRIVDSRCGSCRSDKFRVFEARSRRDPDRVRGLLVVCEDCGDDVESEPDLRLEFHDGRVTRIWKEPA